MPTAKDCHTLTSYYVKAYKERFDRDPDVNRVTARWNFDSLLQGLSMNEVKELIDYYFTTPPTRLYSLDWFFYNYDSLRKAMHETAVDKVHRDKLMQESKQRAEEWRQSGKRGIANS